MPTLNVNHLFGAYDTDLNEDGEWDSDVKYAFTNGHCHSWAVAMHQHTGWEIVGADWFDYDPTEFPDARLPAEVERLPNHILVRDPDGCLWDARGIANAEDAEPMSLDDVKRLVVWGVYRPFAANYAELYLDDYFQQNDLKGAA